MLKKLFAATSLVILMGSMPAFASAGVALPNEVIPTTTLRSGTNCPQLDFGHKVVEKALPSPSGGNTFTASINSILWTVNASDVTLLQGMIVGRPNRAKEVIMQESPYLPKGECIYQIDNNGKTIDLRMHTAVSQDVGRKAPPLTMPAKPTDAERKATPLTMPAKPTDAERKAAHIKAVETLIGQIKAKGVVSRAELLVIIDRVMPR